MTHRILSLFPVIDLDADKHEREIEAEIKAHEGHTHEGHTHSPHKPKHTAKSMETLLHRATTMLERQLCLASLSSWVRSFASSKAFGFFINCMILLSACMMGMQTDPRGQSFMWLWELAEQVFTFLFFFEMVLQVFALRSEYFRKPWRLLDFAVVWTSVVSAWVLPLLEMSSNVLGAMRIFRLFRLFRILRILKAIPELRMVLEGLISSMKALFWVLVLLLIVVYAFSIFCVEMVGSSDAGFPGYNGDYEVIREADTYQNFNNYEYFGDIQRSILTCLSLAFMVEWDAVRPVWEYQRSAIIVFLLLIFVSSFGIVNVIIGVICESTTASMQQVQFGKERKARLEKMRKIRTLSDMVWTADSDSDGLITQAELKTASKNPEILHMLLQMGLPKGFSFQDFHTMLNLDGTEGLHKGEFIDGMHRLLFSSDFQKACTSQLAMGQMKVMTQQFSHLSHKHMHAEFKRIRIQNRRMKAELLAEIRGFPRPRRSPRKTRPKEGDAAEPVVDSASSSCSDVEDVGILGASVKAQPPVLSFSDPECQETKPFSDPVCVPPGILGACAEVKPYSEVVALDRFELSFSAGTDEAFDPVAQGTDVAPGGVASREPSEPLSGEEQKKVVSTEEVSGRSTQQMSSCPASCGARMLWSTRGSGSTDPAAGPGGLLRGANVPPHDECISI